MSHAGPDVRPSPWVAVGALALVVLGVGLLLGSLLTMILAPAPRVRRVVVTHTVPAPTVTVSYLIYGTPAP